MTELTAQCNMALVSKMYNSDCIFKRGTIREHNFNLSLIIDLGAKALQPPTNSAAMIGNMHIYGV